MKPEHIKTFNDLVNKKIDQYNEFVTQDESHDMNTFLLHELVRIDLEIKYLRKKVGDVLDPTA